MKVDWELFHSKSCRDGREEDWTFPINCCFTSPLKTTLNADHSGEAPKHLSFQLYRAFNSVLSTSRHTFFFYLSSWSCNCCCLQFVLFSSRWWQSEEVEKIFTWKCREINLHRLDISFSFAASRKVFVFCARLREHKSGDDWKSVKVSADIDNILSFILCLSLTLLFEFESAMMMIQMWWKMKKVFRTSWCVSGRIWPASMALPISLDCIHLLTLRCHQLM